MAEWRYNRSCHCGGCRVGGWGKHVNPEPPSEYLPRDRPVADQTGTLTAAEVHLIRMKRVPTLTHRDVVDVCDSHEALRADLARVQQERQELRDDLAVVDAVLSRRTALDDAPDRIAKIGRAIKIAQTNDPKGELAAALGRAEAAEARVQALTAEREARRQALDPEAELRMEWWVNHPCETVARYGDDGEMQCSRCGTDFKRLPLEELLMRVTTLRREHLERALRDAAPSPAAPPCKHEHVDRNASGVSRCTDCGEPYRYDPSQDDIEDAARPSPASPAETPSETPRFTEWLEEQYDHAIKVEEADARRGSDAHAISRVRRQVFTEVLQAHHDYQRLVSREGQRTEGA